MKFTITVNCGTMLACHNTVEVSIRDYLLDFLLIKPKIFECEACKIRCSQLQSLKERQHD